MQDHLTKQDWMWPKVIWVVIVSLAVLSCKKGDADDPVPLPTRTILYYLATDNNLHNEANDKIAALQAGFPGGNNQLVIYKDSDGEPPQLLEIYADETGQNQIRTIKTYPEQNSAAGETVQLVLDDLKQLFPTDSYGLILFSHATGWLPQGSLTQPTAATLRGQAHIKTYTVAMDGNDELDLKEFASAIPDHFFDFMVFEACFMAGIEVLYELKDKTDFILSSSAEIVSPGFTPIYPESLPLLFEPKADLVGFARAFFNFWNAQSGDYRSATITVANTAGLPPLAEWVRQHATLEVPPEDLQEIQHFDRYRSHRLFFDFNDYYQRKATPGTEGKLDGFLEDVVVYQAATPTFILNQFGFEIKKHSGVTTYIPQDGFQKLNEKYQELSWYKYMKDNP